MSDLNYPKTPNVAAYPVNLSKSSNLFSRVEPLITPKQFRSRYLKGIQEIVLNPLGIKYDNSEIKDYIQRAANQLELLLNTTIIAEEFTDRVAYDQKLYKSWCFTQTTRKPIVALEELSIITSSGDNVFKIPASWIDMGKAHLGIVTIIPLLSYQTTGTTSAPFGGHPSWVMLQATGIGWIPSYWTVRYRSGLACSLDSIPIVVNELIGTIGAQMMLSSIGPMMANNSVSLSSDGISQSTSGPGSQLFSLRQQELEQKKQTLLNQLKNSMNMNFFSTSI